VFSDHLIKTQSEQNTYIVSSFLHHSHRSMACLVSSTSCSTGKGFAPLQISNHHYYKYWALRQYRLVHKVPMSLYSPKSLQCFQLALHWYIHIAVVTIAWFIYC
jgi:hypothetical protein